MKPRSKDAEVLYEFFKEGGTEEEVDARYEEDPGSRRGPGIPFLPSTSRGRAGRRTGDQLRRRRNWVCCDWSEMLLRMYTMWAEKKGSKFQN